MVSNVFPGHSFYHAGRYVSMKPGAELLDYLGLRGYDYKLMAEDFIAQSELALAAMRQSRDVTTWLSPKERKNALLVKSATSQAPAPAPTPQQKLSPLILELLKTVETESGVPYELTDAYRRKKKKKKGLRP
jgi:hypothetical protein